VANIAAQIPEVEDLSVGLAVGSERRLTNMTLVKEYLGMLACADNPTLSGRQASFVSLVGSKVQVEFEIISRRLQRHVLETAVREKYGDEGVRILRLLLKTGKMDEKQACFHTDLV
jgi:DNA-directed RNA polymerase III subunit RPC3